MSDIMKDILRQRLLDAPKDMLCPAALPLQIGGKDKTNCPQGFSGAALPQTQAADGGKPRSAVCEKTADGGKQQSAAFALSEEALALLEAHWQAVKLTNQSFNLTSITDDGDAAVKHYLDCLYLLPFVPQGARCLDLGSGAGFPGLVLACVRPDTHWLLLDSLNKRCGFLKQTVLELGLKNVEVLHARAEEAGQDKKLREGFELCSARAVTALPVLCELCLPFLKVGGRLAAMKGPALDEELRSAENALRLLGGFCREVRQYELPEQSGSRSICLIEKSSATPAKYPRKPGTPQKQPL